MALTEQLVVRVSGRVDRDVLDRLRSRLQLRRSGRLGDTEDVHFGFRHLRKSDTELTQLTLLRDDDTHWRVKLAYLEQPVPAETVTGLRADILAAVADVGLTIDGVWERRDAAEPAGG